MEAIKLTWYQIFFNKHFGYREDYQTSFWDYINVYIKRYLIDIWYYTNGVKKPYQKRVERKGPRGGRTGDYHFITVPVSKPTHRDLRIRFFEWTWFSITFEFNWSNYVYTKYTFKFGIDKLNWNIEISLNNN